MAGETSLTPPRILGAPERARYAGDTEVQAALAERDVTRDAAKLAIGTAIEAEERLAELLRDREAAGAEVVEVDIVTSGRAPELVGTTEGV